MIHGVVTQVVTELNEHLRTRWLDSSGGRVVASGFHDATGELLPDVRNRIVVQMVNVDEASVPRRTEPRGGSPSPPPLGVSVLFAANFDDYSTSLQAVWDVIAFFWERPVLASDTGDRVSVALQPLTLEDQRNLWSMLGVAYMPSVVFRIVIANPHAA